MSAIRDQGRSVYEASSSLLKNHRHMYVFLVAFILIAMILQWAFQYEVLWGIITNKGLGVGEKIQQVFQAFINLFILIDDVTPVSILLVSLTQSLAITMLVVMKRSKSKVASLGSTTAALVGVGCVSCGGSLLSPILATVASNFSLTLAERLGNIVLFVSLILSCRLLAKVSLQYNRSRY